MSDPLDSKLLKSKVPAPVVGDESDSLPSGWQVIKLGAVTNHEKSSVDPRDFAAEDFDYYSIPAYQEGLHPFVEKGKKILSQKLVVEEGTVLFGKLNPRVPKVWQVLGDTNRRRIASTEFIPLFPRTDHITSDFLYFLCWSDRVMKASQELVSGSTPSRQRVDTRAFLQLPIPLPPLPEQKAIAHVLRTVQQAKEATEKVIAATRQLKQSLMKHLFTYGPVPFDQADKVELKETEIGPVPKHWNVASLDNVSVFLQYGTSKRCHTEPLGTPVLRVDATITIHP